MKVALKKFHCVSFIRSFGNLVVDQDNVLRLIVFFIPYLKTPIEILQTKYILKPEIFFNGKDLSETTIRCHPLIVLESRRQKHYKQSRIGVVSATLAYF